MRDHTYEEIRAAALDILAGRERASFAHSQYVELALCTAEVLSRRDGHTISIGAPGGYELRGQESERFRELFWDLFRQGIITLGLNDSNPNFPFFRLSQFGRHLIDRNEPYFFHDVSSYTEVIKETIPKINKVTLIYLQEAMQAFQTGCLLSAAVMLGVATEHTFLLMLDAISANSTHSRTYSSVFKQKTILQKINKYRNLLTQNLGNYPSGLKEDIDTHFAGILSVIRTFRNDAGHPTGKIVSREQMYVLLHLFIPYCRKLYELTEYYNK
ncbi:MAG: hypothetical protein HF981_04570 [Desulfobacteraceae bacterium]|nr:hypothetical protein [Desulfobacteraceae bacterium]MBC2749639.1 hypothetical protein [Desulfobacteraceae bacterium]